jgi:hypothetical protein
MSISVTFCIVNGKWPQSVASGCAWDKPPMSTRRIQLGTLEILYKNYSPRLLQSCKEISFALPDTSYDIWKVRTMYTLGQSESIFCINFIPEDPSKPQIIHVMRLKDEKQDVSTYPVFCHEHVHLKYILPVEKADQVFDLSKCRVSQTLDNVTPGLIPIVEKALTCFLKDVTSKGLALTLESKRGTPSTYIWLK